MKHPLKQNWIKDITPKCDEKSDIQIIQKVFQEHNYCLDSNCVKLVETNYCTKCLLIQEITDKNYIYKKHEYMLSFNDCYNFKFTIKWDISL